MSQSSIMAEAVTYADLRFVKVPRHTQQADDAMNYEPEEPEIMYENVDSLKAPRASTDPKENLQYPAMARFKKWTPCSLMLLCCLILIGTTIGMTVKYISISREFKALKTVHMTMTQKMKDNENLLAEKYVNLKEIQQELGHVLQNLNVCNTTLQQCQQTTKQTKMSLYELQTLNKNITEEKQNIEDSLKINQAMMRKFEEDYCPHGWIMFEKKCLFFSNIKNSFSESQRECEAKHSTLLVVQMNDQELKDFLASKQIDYWLGKVLVWKNWNLKWEWPSGYPRSITDCGIVTNGVFKSTQCWNKYECICEKSIVPVEMTMKEYYTAPTPQISVWNMQYTCWRDNKGLVVL